MVVYCDYSDTRRTTEVMVVIMKPDSVMKLHTNTLQGLMRCLMVYQQCAYGRATRQNLRQQSTLGLMMMKGRVLSISPEYGHCLCPLVVVCCSRRAGNSGDFTRLTN